MVGASDFLFHHFTEILRRSLKGLATVQVAVIWLVQFLYLLRIWKRELSSIIITNFGYSNLGIFRRYLVSKRIINNARVYLAISVSGSLVEWHGHDSLILGRLALL